MRRILVFFGGLLLMAAFSSLGRAQDACGLPCQVRGDGSGPPAPNEIYIQCASSDCSAECGPCVEIRFWNFYTNGCKITSVEFLSDDAGGQYNVCSATEYDSACAWTFHPDSSNKPCIGDPNCYCVDIDHKESWHVDHPTSGCTVGYGDCLILDYCGLACDKVTWSVKFSNGHVCTFHMKDITTSGNCCAGG